jgi:hypothetical protein
VIEKPIVKDGNPNISGVNGTISKRKLALIHVGKKNLGLGETEYREILLHHGGVESSKDLDDDGFKRVIGEIFAEIFPKMFDHFHLTDGRQISRVARLTCSNFRCTQKPNAFMQSLLSEFRTSCLISPTV